MYVNEFIRIILPGICITDDDNNYFADCDKLVFHEGEKHNGHILEAY